MIATSSDKIVATVFDSRICPFKHWIPINIKPVWMHPAHQGGRQSVPGHCICTSKFELNLNSLWCFLQCLGLQKHGRVNHKTLFLSTVTDQWTITQTLRVYVDPKMIFFSQRCQILLFTLLMQIKYCETVQNVLLPKPYVQNILLRCSNSE